MQGAPEIIRHLNELLRGELAAVNQYFLHASMYRNWGYTKLHKKMYDESIEEMRHAEKLMDRILFLEGTPGMTGELSVRIGRNPQEILENDLALERDGLPELRQGIALSLQHADTGTRELLEHMLVDSEQHIHWLESQLHLIREVGLENYCAQQI